MKEFSVGEEFQMGLKKFRCVKSLSVCNGCAFEHIFICADIFKFTGYCNSCKRDDGNNVIFVEVKQIKHKTMREIKFRGKRIDNGEWVYGTVVNSVNDKCYMVHGATEDAVNSNNKVDFYFSEVNPDTIGQYTGLKTKEGKEVWEGDILKIKEYDNLGMLTFTGDELKVFSFQDLTGNLRREWKGEIKHGNASFFIGDMWLDGLFGDMRCSSPIYEFEVIGNIHDNPELLED